MTFNQYFALYQKVEWGGCANVEIVRKTGWTADVHGLRKEGRLCLSSCATPVNNN